MSGTSTTLRFGITVADVQHWTPEHRAAAENADDYTDWVSEQIQDVMLRAGRQFIDAHPDLFRGEIV